MIARFTQMLFIIFSVQILLIFLKNILLFTRFDCFITLDLLSKLFNFLWHLTITFFLIKILVGFICYLLCNNWCYSHHFVFAFCITHNFFLQKYPLWKLAFVVYDWEVKTSFACVSRQDAQQKLFFVNLGCVVFWKTLTPRRSSPLLKSFHNKLFVIKILVGLVCCFLYNRLFYF